MLVSESSAMHQLRRRWAQKPPLDLIADRMPLLRNWWWKLLSGNELKIERFGFFSEPNDAL
jgi:hypothetical protein